jgi:hypothetical protein
MPRWHVEYIGKRSQYLGTVDAADPKSAVDAAAKLFSITPALRNKIGVTKIDDKK